MAFEDMPGFLDQGTFLWMERGYFHSGNPPTNPLSPDSLNSADAWIVVTSVLENAKRGKHAPVSRLKDIVARDDISAFLVHVCLSLIGDAGRQRDLQDLASMMTNPKLRVEACHGAWGAGCLWLAPHMLKAWSDSRLEDHRASISLYLALMLEDHWLGDIACSLDSTPEGYVRLVDQHIGKLRSAVPSDQTPVWWGKPFGVRAVADQMRELLVPEAEEPSNLRGMFPHLRRKFEAATGIDCSRFYRDEELQPLAAAALIDAFLESPEAAKYEDGVRYFFGHRIPD
jgi:hypothetical protein